MGKQQQVTSGLILRSRTKVTGDVAANMPNLILSQHMTGQIDEAPERVHTVRVRNVLRVLSES